MRSSVCFQGRPAKTCRKEGTLEALLHSLEVLAKGNGAGGSTAPEPAARDSKPS